MNAVFIFLILASFATALARLIFLGDTEVLANVTNSTFAQAKNGFEIALYLTGVLTLWMGIMKVGEDGGAVRILSRLISPLFVRLFPEVPRNHPSYSSILMNLAANMLGLDNAATPMGLKAMSQLQELNPRKDTASNAQIMLLVLNTSGLTLIPISIMAYRTQCGAANPADIFLPLLLTTFFSTLAGLVATSIVQKINLFNKVVMLYLGSISAVVAALIYAVLSMPQEKVGAVSGVATGVILLSVICGFMLLGMRHKVNVYSSFIAGAKDGFNTAVGIIPYLVAILVAVGMFRASGALDFVIEGIRWVCGLFCSDVTFVDALPTAFMKPLSGSGARGFMIEVMNTYGGDSYVGRLSCMFQGAADTTFYILAVYFGSVGVSKTRHAVACGLIADVAGVIMAIVLCSIFFG